MAGRVWRALWTPRTLQDNLHSSGGHRRSWAFQHARSTARRSRICARAAMHLNPGAPLPVASGHPNRRRVPRCGEDSPRAQPLRSMPAGTRRRDAIIPLRRALPRPRAPPRWAAPNHHTLLVTCRPPPPTLPSLRPAAAAGPARLRPGPGPRPRGRVRPRPLRGGGLRRPAPGERAPQSPRGGDPPVHRLGRRAGARPPDFPPLSARPSPHALRTPGRTRRRVLSGRLLRRSPPVVRPPAEPQRPCPTEDCPTCSADPEAHSVYERGRFRGLPIVYTKPAEARRDLASATARAAVGGRRR